jgi:hypothetical protein
VNTDYPGAVTPGVWKVHADSGRTTWTAGAPPQWDAAFIDKKAAVAFAAENYADLFEWTGRHGRPIEVPETEMEMEIG